MAWSSIGKPNTTTYTSIANPSVIESPYFGNILSLWNDITQTWDNYTQSIYNNIDKPPAIAELSINEITGTIDENTTDIDNQAVVSIYKTIDKPL